MNNLKLVANNVQLDTYGDEEISLNYAISDLIDVSKRATSFSKTITIPGTPTNNAFFKHIWDVNIDREVFNTKLSIPAYISVNDSIQIRGNLQLLEIIIDNKDVAYSITISGQLKNIINSFDEYVLQDLDLSEYNHKRNVQNIRYSWDYKMYVDNTLVDYSGPGKGFVYPYIVNGNSQNIWDHVYAYDLYPAVYVKTIIDKMFEKFSFSYTSEFFNSEYFSKLIIPYTDDKLTLSEEQMLDRTAIVGVPSSSSYVDISGKAKEGDAWWYNSQNSYRLGGLTRESGTVTDNGTEIDFTDTDNIWRNDIITINKTGRYDISFDGKLIPAITHQNGRNNVEFKSGAFEYEYKLLVLKTNGSFVTLDSSGVQQFGLSAGVHDCSGGKTWYDEAGALVFNPNAQNVMLETGDRVYVKIGFKYPSSVKWYGLTDKKHEIRLTLKQSLGGDFTKFEIKPSSNESLGDEDVDMNTILPSGLKMKDFFMDIVKMFKLMIMDNPDKPGDLIIEPEESFYATKQKVKDWTHMLDNESNVILTPMAQLDAKLFEYKYATDSDLYNSEYTDEFDLNYGDLNVDVNNDFSDEIITTELKFAPTPNAMFWINSRVAPFFAELDNEQYKTKKVKPRILFYGGLKGAFDWNISLNPAGTKTALTSYPYCGMWDDPYDPKYSLEFGRTKKLYWNATKLPNSNLFQQFHKYGLKNITDVNSEMMEASFDLSSTDIADFDFRDVIFIDGTYWRVSEIQDYNPAAPNLLTTVILYKIVDINVLSPYTIQLPSSNAGCPAGIQVDKTGGIWKYKSRNGIAVKKNCCTILGGVWDETTQTCEVDLGTGMGDPDVGDPILIGDPIIRGGGIVGIIENPGISINAGQGVVPYTEQYGPLIHNRNGNSINSSGIKVFGEGNHANGGTQVKLMIGNNNSAEKDITDTIIIGNGITAKESGTLYLGNVKIDQTGNITTNLITIIDGGNDEVFAFDKTNYIDIIDGTADAVRNFGGDSKARPIISGNEENEL